ncbi:MULTISPECIES: hypothetical protein [Pseudomonas]|jgi:hypothetical protein|uniref:hypothetical protein n=1 Tax=Pseudomonas TaxID=286 RepID=UPI0015E457CD|nr:MULTISPECIES: hypothetical protein [Pseudomonas]MBA1300097.1 hypothetical protein [Pseudomonas carnis]MBJ2203090.1 hypothetical protein [Pseudomonas carnis]MBW9245429.1 hypothetical protein [Pseudomonas paracarnis]ULN82660.1 hypothetical protein HXW87_10900 [Pseudomonas sp. Y5-11]
MRNNYEAALSSVVENAKDAAKSTRDYVRFSNVIKECEAAKEEHSKALPSKMKPVLENTKLTGEAKTNRINSIMNAHSKSVKNLDKKIADAQSELANIVKNSTSSEFDKLKKSLGAAHFLALHYLYETNADLLEGKPE